jgi:hypothetical protein
MSRTIRTNKYGETKTDKFQSNFNGCGCVYCEHINTDSRNKHLEKHTDHEIKKQNYIEDRYDEWDNVVYEEDHYLDEVSENIMRENELSIEK